MDFESSNEILLCHYIFDLQFFDNETTALLKKLEACAGISFVFLILLRGSLHALSHPGVNSLRSFKKSLILFTRNKRDEFSPRRYFTPPLKTGAKFQPGVK